MTTQAIASYLPKDQRHPNSFATVLYNGKKYAVTLLTGPSGSAIPLSDSDDKTRKIATLVAQLLKAHELQHPPGTAVPKTMNSQGLHFTNGSRPDDHNFQIQRALAKEMTEHPLTASITASFTGTRITAQNV